VELSRYRHGGGGSAVEAPQWISLAAGALAAGFGEIGGIGTHASNSARGCAPEVDDVAHCAPSALADSTPTFRREAVKLSIRSRAPPSRSSSIQASSPSAIERRYASLETGPTKRGSYRAHQRVKCFVLVTARLFGDACG
jgi:hypothetical protein